MTTVTQLSLFEIQSLCHRYLKDGCNTRYSKTAVNDNFRIHSYKSVSSSDAPSGFLGRHQYLTVEIVFEDKDGYEKMEKLSFFIKSAPIEIASRMDYIEEFGVFKKEVLVYTKVLPNLENIFPGLAPKCYYADRNVLVFENLAQRGYKMPASRDGLVNYEHLNCLLRTLAAMHTASIVHEIEEGRKIDELYPEAVAENAYPICIDENHVRVQNFKNANLVLIELIKKLPKYQNKLDCIFRGLSQKMELIFQFTQTSQKYVNVFSHGDLWANNIMFQHSKFGEIPIECRMVDFQLARYAPPIIDVATVLTIPTSQRFRAQHMSELLSDYYRFMTEFLKRKNLNIDDFMPEKEFYESFKEFGICGLIESFLFSHLTILPPELTENLTSTADGFSDFFNRKRVNICVEAFQKDEIYRNRLTDMIEDLVDNYVLKDI